LAEARDAVVKLCWPKPSPPASSVDPEGGTVDRNYFLLYEFIRQKNPTADDQIAVEFL
jgi:hypothetical protein